MTNFTPSPNSYQSALHGLLTLGSRDAADDHVVATSNHPVHQLVPRPGSTLNNFAVEPTLVDVDQDSAATSNMWHPDSHFHLDACTTISAGRVEPRMFGHNVPLSRASRGGSIQVTPTATIEDSAYSEQIDRASLEDDLTLLKTYRYQIAPWVSAS